MDNSWKIVFDDMTPDIWTPEEKKLLIAVLDKSYESDFSNKDAYNYWYISKLRSGIYARRMTWDLGGMTEKDFDTFLVAFKEYYRVS